MEINAKKDVHADFTVDELKLLVAASTNNGIQFRDSGITETVNKLLNEKFGGSGFISGDEICYWATEHNVDVCPEGSWFNDIEWG